MRLRDATYRGFQNSDREVGLIPAGSIEQHGPHAPLSTDLIIAEEITEQVAQKTHSIVLPSISVGISEEHRDFDGSLYISPDTFRQHLTEIVLSAKSGGIEKFVVVNGHGGNISAIYEVCKNLYLEYTTIALEWTWFNAISASNMGHAGELETSLIMYLRPDLIGVPPKESSNTWGHRIGGTRIDYLTSSFSSNGVVGDPAKASKEKGKELFNRSTKKLTGLIKEMKESDFEVLFKEKK